LKLTNFRNYEDFEIEFNENLNVIVAENGAGKTTILDAIAIGYGAMLTRFPKVKGKTFESSDLRHNNENKLSPYMRIELETYNNLFWDRTQTLNKSKAIKKLIPQARGLHQLYLYLDSVIDKEHTFEKTLETKNTHVIVKTKIDKEEYVTVEIKDELPLIMYYGTSRAVLKSPMRKRNFKKEFSRYEALSGSIEAYTNFTRLFQWFDAMQNEENQQIKIQRNFDYKLAELEAVRKALSVMLPNMKNPRIITRPLRFVVDQEVDGHEVTFRIDQLSDGYKTVLAMVMDISARMAEANPHLKEQSNNSEALIMIDEVDLHLHPRWQQTILIDLQKAFPNAQFIVTTHSPQVLTTVESSAIQIISNSKLYSAPLGTEGAEASRILKRVFGVELRAPQNSVTIKLNKYLDLVYNDKWDEALALREELDNIFGGEEPVLTEADLYIENRKWEMEIEEDS